MNILCSLPQAHERLIAFIYTVVEDDKLSQEIVRMKLLQDEQRMNWRTVHSAESYGIALSIWTSEHRIVGFATAQHVLAETRRLFVISVLDKAPSH